MASIQIKVPDWLERICAWPVMVYRRHKYGYSYRRIYLGEGEWTIVDQQDYYRYQELKWLVKGNGSKLYAVGSVKTEPKRTRITWMHREIMNAPKELLVDHKNGDSLDNRRENLRFATQSQNRANAIIDKSKTTSRFRGVNFDNGRRRWLASIKKDGKKKFLGRFKNEIDAARAYDAAAKKCHGEFARLNFPD